RVGDPKAVLRVRFDGDTIAKDKSEILRSSNEVVVCTCSGEDCRGSKIRSRRNRR
ncbi:hypothetical protein ACLOJK_036506, partial [Asimina triloba]